MVTNSFFCFSRVWHIVVHHQKQAERSQMTLGATARIYPICASQPHHAQFPEGLGATKAQMISLTIFKPSSRWQLAESWRKKGKGEEKGKGRQGKGKRDRQKDRQTSARTHAQFFLFCFFLQLHALKSQVHTHWIPRKFQGLQWRLIRHINTEQVAHKLVMPLFLHQSKVGKELWTSFPILSIHLLLRHLQKGQWLPFGHATVKLTQMTIL